MAAFLRLYQLPAESIWYDEAFSVDLAKQTLFAFTDGFNVQISVESIGKQFVGSRMNDLSQRTTYIMTCKCIL